MSPTSAKTIQKAVESGEFGKALDLWKEFAGAIAAAGPTRESLAEAAELIERCRPLLLAARGAACEQLNLLRIAGAYGRSDAGRSRIRESF
jgi:hypothetical protein